jgi:hypothetical protein
MLAGLLCSAVLSQGCQPPEPHTPDVTPPRTFAVPAGGIYRTFPTQIQLLTEAGARLFYRWQDGQEQQYTGPVRVPESTTGSLTLHYWAQDAAGNTEPWRREHYVLDPRAAPVEILGLDRPVLGRAETTTLQWRSAAADATYEIAVTASGWGAGRRVASGQVVPGEIQQTSIPGTALRPGMNRLWLRVQSRAGETGATSRLLLCHATPATTRAWPASGVFGSPPTVQLLTERQATIYYTTDGSEPTLDSAQYTTPLRFETSTRLRYFSLDPYGNRAAPHEEHYEIRPRVPTIMLRTISGFEVESEAQVVFTWQSDTAGHYDVNLRQRADGRAVTVLQGKVERGRDMRSVIARNFLTPGDWQVQIQVQAAPGQTGQLSFWLRVRYVERFMDTRYLDTAATTAAWDTTQRHVRLSRGPHLLGTYDTRGRSRQVVTHGEYAFLANGSGGLHIVDVSNLQQPQRAGVWYPHGKATALAKYGPYVYLAAGGSGITIIEVTPPTTPRLVATVPLHGSASDIVIVPPYAYVGTAQGLLYIFDLTTPLRPHLLGQVEVEGHVVDMAVADGIAYLACLKQGIIIVDVRQPQHPRLLHHWPTAAAATGIAVHEQRAYVAAGALEILDVQRPETPVRAAIRGGLGTYGVAVLPPYVLVASGTDGVQVVPLDGSQVISQTRTTHYAARLAVTGQRALVADTQGGLRIIDLAQPDQPRLLAALEDIGTIVDVVVDGSFAYLADDRHGSGVVVVDVSLPTTPRVVGQYHNQATSAVVVWNQLALVGDEAGLVHLVDMQQPTRPRVLGSLAVPGKVQHLTLRPPYVLVAGDDAGLHVVEVTPDHLMQLRATVPMTGRALDIALVQRTAYVAAASGGIQVVDVSTPLHPQLGTPYHHSDGKGDEVIRLLAHQQHLYALDSERGVQIFTGVETGRLQWHGSFVGLDGAPWALTAAGPYLFITTLLNSLYVMDVTVPAQPRLLSTAPYGGAGVHATGRHLYIAVRGRRGVPGGLHVVEAFASVSPDTMQYWRARGVPTLVDGSAFLVNRAYTFNAPGVVQSTVLSAPDAPVLSAVLQVEDFWGSTGHIRYELSNDGGAHWHEVQAGEAWHFAAPGTDLRWRATLLSTDLATTPTLEAVRIEYTTGGQTPP